MAKRRKAEETKVAAGTRDVETVVVVGCGGGLYHDMAGLVVNTRACAAAGVERSMVFVDGDRLEERNMARQAWPGDVGSNKATCACDLWESYMRGRFEVQVVARMVEDQMDMRSIVETAVGPRSDMRRLGMIVETDNDLPRRWGARVVEQMVYEGRIDAGWYATGGEGPGFGQAYVARVKPGGGWAVPWVERHQDMWRDAAEGQAQVAAEVVRCADNQAQEALSNMLTSQCLLRGLEELRTTEVGGVDWHWMLDRQTGVYRMWRKGYEDEQPRRIVESGRVVG